MLIKKVTKIDPTLRNQTSEKVKVIKELHEMNQFGLSLLFKVTEIAKSVYYYWIKRFKTQKDIDIVKSIKQICKKAIILMVIVELLKH